MHYTVAPKEKHAKAYGSNMRISAKKAALLCRVIRKKPLKRARRLLEDLSAERRDLDGKHYTKTAREMLMLLNSCEKNAEALGLDTGFLMVHASAHKGTNMRRRRRKQKFGSAMKTANVEVVLVERVPKDYVKKTALKKESLKKPPKEENEAKQAIGEMKEKTEALREKSEEIEKQVEEIAGKDIPTHADERKSESK